MVSSSCLDLIWWPCNEISSFCNIPQEASARAFRAFRVFIYQEYHYDKYRTMNKKCVYKKNMHGYMWIVILRRRIVYCTCYSYMEGIKNILVHVYVDLYYCIHKRKTTLIQVYCKYDCRCILYSYLFGMLGMARHTCSIMLFWSVLIISDHREMYPLSAERTGWRKEYIVAVLLWRCRRSDLHKHTLYSVMIHRSKQ